jgi:hypothetical protein
MLPHLIPPDETKDWNGDAVEDLRERHGLTKTDLGRLLYDTTSPHSPVIQLEEGDMNAGAAARRTLSRLSRMSTEAVRIELEGIEEAAKEAGA